MKYLHVVLTNEPLDLYKTLNDLTTASLERIQTFLYCQSLAGDSQQIKPLSLENINQTLQVYSKAK